MAALILNSAGKPEPSPEIQRRLRQVHHGLSLVYVPDVNHVWGVSLEWERNDPRWEMVQRQEISAADAWDIIGYLPRDCGPEQAPSYLERMLRTHPREEVSRIGNRMSAYNATVAQRAVEATIADVMQGNPAEFESKKVTGKRTRHIIPKSS